ncbi:MAG TPA: hypothetical protein VG407_18195 [Caulobacteraceae bacterium]|jgi:hypothetical protein|nr:hypothetical protein [Caulobacteraceae bacterium]
MRALPPLLVLTLSLAFAGACAAQSSAVTIEQIGSGNSATVDQSRGAGDVSLNQTGDDNIASVRETGAGYGTAALTQTGSSNLLSLLQENGLNTAVVDQEGVGDQAILKQRTNGVGSNYAALTQVGNGDMASLTQNGQGNSSTQVQIGANDTQSVSQTGDFNQVSYTQIGNNLPDLKVVQSGGMKITIVQTGH